MTVAFLVLNAAYLFYVVSAAFKNMLPLRVLLLVSTVLFIAYGIIEPLWPLVFWNLPFGVMQSYHIWVLLKQRMGIDLNEEAEAVRVLMFSQLDRAQFNLLWQAGSQKVYRDDEVIIEFDDVVEDLTLILEGEVDVFPPNQPADDPIRLGRLRLLGEMSTVGGGTARATVVADGLVRTRSWPIDVLDELGKAHPAIEKNALIVIGNELTRKVS